MQGRENHDHGTIIEGIKEFSTELYDSKQSTSINTDVKMYPR